MKDLEKFFRDAADKMLPDLLNSIAADYVKYGDAFVELLDISAYLELDFLTRVPMRKHLRPAKARFYLENTPFCLDVSNDNKHWHRDNSGVSLEPIGLDDILEEIDEELQEKIIFHLDLLQETGYKRRNNIPSITKFIQPGVFC